MSEVARVVESIRTNYASHICLSKAFREQQLRALYTLLDREENVLCTALSQDLKKPKSESFLLEIQQVKNSISSLILCLHDQTVPSSVSGGSLAFMMDRLETRRVPLGVVLIISPWNYPVQLALNAFAGAIAGGNAAILKPSEYAPNTASALAKLIPKYLDSRVYRVVEGGIPETTRLLELKFDLIFYTGSTQVGRIVMKAAAQQLTPVVLELGGKSPVIVDSSVDPAIAAKRIVWGKVINCGQTCIAPDYIVVHKDIIKPFVAAVKASITELLSANVEKSPYYGRIINKKNFDRLIKVLQEQRKADGCKVVHGGAANPDSLYIEPTVLTLGKNCLKDPIMKEEIFGPLMPIVEVDSVDDAISFVKNVTCRVGDPLSLYVFTKKAAVWEKVFASINCGNAVVNDTLMNAGVQDLPFGGVNESGMGSYHGIHSFKTFTREQGFFIRGISTDLVNYPRYQNVSGDVGSRWYKIVRYLMNASLPSKFYLFVLKLARILGGRTSLVAVFFFLIGFKSKAKQ